MEISSKDIFLLDTQVLLWLITGSSRLDEKKFQARFNSEAASFYYSQVSLWEIQTKFDLKKLPLSKRPGPWLKEAIEDSGINYLNILDTAIFALGKLPNIHKDPFDRLIIAQALVNGLTLITSDEKLETYPVNIEII